jgi:hypothetical protein
MRESAPGETFSVGYILVNKDPKKINHEFLVRNTTQERVRILKVIRSCTCSSFTFAKSELMPGESSVLTISVQPINHYSHKVASCVLKTDHPKFADWTYSLEFVSLPFAFADPEVLSLGTMKVDDQNLQAVQHVTLDLFADSRLELRRDDFTVPDEIELKVSPDPEVRQLQRGIWNTRYQLSVGLSSRGRETVVRNPQPEITNKTIEVKVNGSTAWQYTVYWQIPATVQCFPTHLNFGNLLDETDDHRRTVAISSTSGETFRVISVTNESRDFQVEAIFDPSNDATRHSIRIRAPKRSGAENLEAIGSGRFLSGTIQIQTTAKLPPVLRIPWTALTDSAITPLPRAN